MSANLLSILSNAASSLATQRGVTAVAGNNINNANTPGYARQTAVVEAVAPVDQVGGNFFGRGSQLTSVQQVRDRFLEAQLPQAFGQAASSTAQSDALQAFHGLDPEAPGGLGPAISGFYAALTSMAQNPSDSGQRSSFLGAAQALAQSFNTVSQTIEASRTGIDAQVNGLVAQINAEAVAVANLNASIQAASGNPSQPPNDLLDQRQKHLDKLAELTGGTPVPTSENFVNVMLPGGIALVAGTKAGVLSALPDPANNGHLALQLQQPDGVSVVTLTGSGVGGTMGGALAARDGALATAGARVDQLAFDFAEAINTVHQNGFGLDGSTGNALYDVGATVAGAASHMQVVITDPKQIATAASANASGDATNANALLATANQALSGGTDVQATVSDIVSQFGATAQTAQSFADQDSAIRDQLNKMRDSVSGVSIDEEMVTMQASQRAYEAIAKIIQTADQMMQTLLALKS